ncbi:toprim domain-containing protein [Aeromicrobium wangtongii]|uniref:Toprim domain-containing protein n=1 Tax=Aeromicrobium wangtongii TaxID=2969247 RepID=A0ABY5M234_9ACTN|nr:toprim domain-containing protein [Aeromicrobium wangtongii]MCD9198234.1 toprim domain-containing protein [Aeromicrobium wangtongii]UUP12270.1 toprim domain-containing protein [Aeromicrobium wangtongii]
MVVGPIFARRSAIGIGSLVPNTADTIVFHKGAQLFGIAETHMADGSIPVLVEGPMDAIAVTVATGGAYLGVAPLGTSLTAEQAAHLAALGAHPVVAIDGDLAGQVAAERDYWLLSPHGVNPQHAPMPAGQDPASLLADRNPTALRAALFNAGPLADVLIDERLTHLSAESQKVVQTADIIAGQPAAQWDAQIARTTERIGVPAGTIRGAVTAAAQAWNDDRRRASGRQLDNITAVRARMQAADDAIPAERWAPLAQEIDPRLTEHTDWPATAAMLQDVHNAGHDLPSLTRQLVAEQPLGETPAQELRYLLVSYLPDDETPVAAPVSERLHQSAERDRADTLTTRARPHTGPSR